MTTLEWIGLSLILVCTFINTIGNIVLRKSNIKKEEAFKLFMEDSNERIEGK